MKYYIGDFNGILNPLKQKLVGKLATPREADVWITFQDIQGSYGDLFQSSVALGINKPTYCVQHGRAASLDYGPPNNFILQADKFLCWGKADYERMSKLGYADRTIPVGCTLNSNILPKVPHPEKVVLFVPVNTGKEEPENIAVYYELLKLRYNKAQAKVLRHKENLKDRWGFDGKLNVKFNELANSFDVVTKLLPWHDKSLYHGNTISGYQDSPQNNQLVFNLLRNVDLVVGLDEGTTEIFAYGHDVPVIIVDGFNYRQHENDGKHFSIMETYKTKAATHVKLEDLAAAIEYGLLYPEHLKKERAEVAEAELGLSYGNATENILKLVREDAKAKTSLHTR